MNEHQIIDELQRLSQLLDDGKVHVDAGDWDAVAKCFAEVEAIQSNIKSNTPSVETLIEANNTFKSKFEPLKAVLMEKTGHIISVIETWKEQHTGKIADSKNTLDNISKFYKPNSTSYYIDRKE